jgi:hypothetical protein
MVISLERVAALGLGHERTILDVQCSNPLDHSSRGIVEIGSHNPRFSIRSAKSTQNKTLPMPHREETGVGHQGVCSNGRSAGSRTFERYDNESSTEPAVLIAYYLAGAKDQILIKFLPPR